MKLLKGLGIGLRVLNKFTENLSYSWVYSPVILSLGFIGSFLLLLLFDIESHYFIIIVSFNILLVIVALTYIGKIRKKELTIIKNNIRSIRQNIFSEPDEIKLSKQMQDLEDEIKAMFLRTKNDISNLKKLEQVRTEFLGNVSHELRTPIFAIQGFLETLLDGAIDDPKVNRAFLQKANHHAMNLNSLLNDLIDISMIEAGQMKMSFRYFNISDFLQSIVLEMKYYAKDGIELILTPVNSKLQVYGDKDKLKQVMTNLIMNALKYTEKGKVEVGVEEQEKRCMVFVKDTGLGISPENLARIFERFYRVDKNRSRAVGGTGLGLAIVKHIVDAHNSKVEVESELSKGSKFSFYLKK